MTGRSRSGSGTSPGSRTDADDRGAAGQDRRLSPVRVEPVAALVGHVAVPGRTARSPTAVLVGAIAEGDADRRLRAPVGHRIHDLAMRTIGVEVLDDDVDTLRVRGRGLTGLDVPTEAIGVRERGHADADAPRHPRRPERPPVRARRRRVALRTPDGAVAVPLRRMGAAVRTTDGHAPLAVDGASCTRSTTSSWRPRRSSPPSSSRGSTPTARRPSSSGSRRGTTPSAFSNARADCPASRDERQRPEGQPAGPRLGRDPGRPPPRRRPSWEP